MSGKGIKRGLGSAERKVVIMLQDHDAIGKVYAKLNSDLTAKEVLIEAMTRLESGIVYADKECKQLISGDFIEVQSERRARKGKEDFIFLIDRQDAHMHIIGAKILN